MNLDREKLKEQIPLTETAFLVLLAMYDGNHGYGVLKFVEEITGGRVVFGPGTLYGAINNLTQKGWIHFVREDEENRRKEYEITEEGKELVLLELERMEQILTQGLKVVQEKKSLAK